MPHKGKNLPSMGKFRLIPSAFDNIGIGNKTFSNVTHPSSGDFHPDFQLSFNDGRSSLLDVGMTRPSLIYGLICRNISCADTSFHFLSSHWLLSRVILSMMQEHIGDGMATIFALFVGIAFNMTTGTNRPCKASIDATVYCKDT